MDFKYIIIRASSALLLLSGPLFTACDDDDPDAFITVSKQEIEVEYNGLTANGETVNFDLGSNHAWQATYVEEWIHPTHTEGDRGRTRIFLAIDENDTGKDREGYVIFEGGGSRRTVAVTQKLKIDALMVSPGKLTVVRSGLLETGEKASVYISANSDWTIEPSGDSGWITPSKTSGKAGEEDVELTIAQNTTGAVRTGTFVVVAGSKRATVTVTQNLEGLKVSAASFKVNKFGFADEDRVVLRTAGEDLQDAAYLLVTAYNRVELALAGFLNEVLGVFLKTLIVLVARLRLHLLALSQFLNCLHGFSLRHAGILQNAACSRIDLKQGEQYRLNTCELVAVLGGEVLRTLKHVVGIVRQIWLSTLNAWESLYFTVYNSVYLIGIDTELLEDVCGYVFGFHHHTLQQVHRLNALLSLTLCGVDSFLNNLLGFDCEFVECHILFSFLDLF